MYTNLQQYIFARKICFPEIFILAKVLCVYEEIVAKVLYRVVAPSLLDGGRVSDKYVWPVQIREREPGFARASGADALRTRPNPSERAFESRLPRQCRYRVRGPRFTVCVRPELFCCATRVQQLILTAAFSSRRTISTSEQKQTTNIAINRTNQLAEFPRQNLMSSRKCDCQRNVIRYSARDEH